MLLTCNPVLDFALAQEAIPGPSFEDVLSLRSVGSPAISPDGSAIAFRVGTTDWKENTYDGEIWLVRDGEEPFQLTRTEDGGSSSPRWSSDGRWISFLANRGEEKQIYVIRPNGGEAQPVTATDEGVTLYRWSPDGTRIAFTMTEPETDQMKDRADRFGDFSVEDAEYRQSHLWIIEVETDLWPTPAEAPCPDDETEEDSQQTETSCAALPEPERLTEGDFNVRGFEWSPDGTRIAIEHTTTPQILAFMTADISILTLETGEIVPLIESPGYDGRPIWSPDSKEILFSTDGGDTTKNFYANRQIARIPAAGGRVTRLATNLDENPGAVVWTPTGIFMTVSEGTRRYLYKVDSASGRASRFATSPDRFGAIDFTPDGTKMAFTGRTESTLSEVYKASLDPFEPVAVTDMTSQIVDWEIGTVEIVRWTSYDGTEIEGVLHKPTDFDYSRQYPLFVIIHGGPTGIDYPTPVLSYVYPAMQWLAKGALVLRPNYRGSAGYGEAFRSLNVRNLGVGDAWDVLSGVDYLIDVGIVDTTRMGAMGWSQGGYISAFLTTNTDRFKAISVGAGISNWMTYYVNTDIHPFTRQYLQATPWEDPDIYAVTSPMSTINQAGTPTLIQHGEFDRRVPIPNAYELFQGLQDVGVETKLIVYKRLGHGISRPKERLAAVWHNWQWFGKHVWGEDIELPGKADEEMEE